MESTASPSALSSGSLSARGSDAAAPRTTYIAGSVYDRIFFIFSPLLALALAIAGSFTPLAQEKFLLYGRKESWMSLFSGAFTMAHLFIVFFRSHGNADIFRKYPARFLAAPALLFTAMALSSWALVFIFVLAVWWDVYHSSLQTFGLGRIYDAKLGNDPIPGRSLDRGLNLLLYIGPVLGGLSLAGHVTHFNKFSEVGTPALAQVPFYLLSGQKIILAVLVGVGVPYVAYYLLSYRMLAKQGYRISWNKILLLVSTAICSIYAWGWNPFGQAFFIMNFFHALQYFALVWWVEKGSIQKLFFLQKARFGAPLAATLFILIGMSYGLWAKLFGESHHLAFSLLLTVSIMHFWYDGFVWSVRRREV